MTSLSLFLVIVATSTSFIIWRLARSLISSSPLDNVPGPKSLSYSKGNIEKLFDRTGWGFLDDLGTKYNKVVRLTGLFGHRMLYVFDPTALQYIVLKDAGAYEIPEWAQAINHLTVGPSILGVRGETHRKQRKILNPVFSVKHMRSLAPIFYAIAHKLCTSIDAQVGHRAIELDIMAWLSRVSLELIGQGGLGCSLDMLEKPTPNVFGDALKDMTAAIFAFAELQFFSKHVKKLGPAWFRDTLANMIPISKITRLRNTIRTIETESVKILRAKKIALQAGEAKVTEQVGEGKDIMSVLLKANMNASVDEGLSDAELLAQMGTLAAAATDTTSNALTKMMEILAHDSGIQERLRAEITEAQGQYGKDIPHDELVALPYMDAFCRETLRLYPPVPQIMREAQNDTIMPLSKPMVGVDGASIQEIIVPAGTTIVIAIRSWNLDKDVWGDNALEFKPERWMNPLPSTVTESRIPGVYSNLMTFHGGGRSCVGFKFSQLEIKVLLSVLLPKFRISPAGNTKDVVWNLSGIQYPTLGRESNKPAFPITMERISI
ncbi:hypothetical protein QCA50_020289 [Cerrena zonata]|uniref:Cytochrome P450 n=1 Tax=Cerrena zonata TaxID=2478898 RepID=A0AAW0F9F3_9APHY